MSAFISGLLRAPTPPVQLTRKSNSLMRLFLVVFLIVHCYFVYSKRIGCKAYVVIQSYKGTIDIFHLNMRHNHEVNADDPVPYQRGRRAADSSNQKRLSSDPLYGAFDLYFGKSSLTLPRALFFVSQALLILV